MHNNQAQYPKNGLKCYTKDNAAQLLLNAAFLHTIFLLISDNRGSSWDIQGYVMNLEDCANFTQPQVMFGMHAKFYFNLLHYIHSFLIVQFENVGFWFSSCKRNEMQYKGWTSEAYLVSYIGIRFEKISLADPPCIWRICLGTILLSSCRCFGFFVWVYVRCPWE